MRSQRPILVVTHSQIDSLSIEALARLRDELTQATSVLDPAPIVILSSPGVEARFVEQAGASLRDHFAGLAFHAELNTAGAHKEPARCLADAARAAGRTIEQQVAHNAYLLADAMLAERKKAEAAA